MNTLNTFRQGTGQLKPQLSLPPPPDPGQIGGFEKGPADQITPRPPAPGENLEINSSLLGTN